MKPNHGFIYGSEHTKTGPFEYLYHAMLLVIEFNAGVDRIRQNPVRIILYAPIIFL